VLAFPHGRVRALTSYHEDCSPLSEVYAQQWASHDSSDFSSALSGTSDALLREQIGSLQSSCNNMSWLSTNAAIDSSPEGRGRR
jgi:hypothetical protein